MKVWRWVVCVALCAGVWGCERGAAGSGEGAVSGPKRVIKGVKIEVEPGPAVAGAPGEEALRAELVSALKARSAWRYEEGAAGGTHLRFAYVYQQAETPQGPVLLLLLDGSLGMSKTEAGEALPLACERVVGDEPGAAKRSTASELMSKGIKACLDDLEGALEVDSAPDARLGELLLRGAALPRAGALRALGRVREGRLVAAAPGVRAQLKGEDRQVALAAAATAVALKDRESAAAMVEAAEALSRARAWPDLVAMLTHLGDLGGDVASKYLAAVAQGHEQVEVQRVAAAALARAGGR